MVVVDDGEGMDQSIKRLLFGADYRVATGFELRQRLVDGGAQLPVIFLTALDGFSSPRANFLAGVSFRVSTPQRRGPYSLTKVGFPGAPMGMSQLDPSVVNET